MMLYCLPEAKYRKRIVLTNNAVKFRIIIYQINMYHFVFLKMPSRFGLNDESF